MKSTVVLAGLLLALPALAQESAGFKLSEHVFNAGGHPHAGNVLVSSSFRIALDAIGDGLSAGPLGSASFSMDVGFPSAYPPPAEVTGLLFSDKENLEWDPERSVGFYNLYRDSMDNLIGLGFGSCEQQDLPDATAIDTDGPDAGDGFVYLVTAENRLSEEGTKGFQNDGTERANAAPCQ